MADEKIDYFDGIRSHFEELEVKIIEVPEWGLVGDKAIYAKPFNMQEKSKIFKGANSNDIGVLVDVIIEKALDKDHKKMFNATQTKSRYRRTCKSSKSDHGYSTRQY